MKRFVVVLTVLVAGLVAVATTAAKPHATGTKVIVGQTELGPILENASGFTLYVFTLDPAKKDKCVKINDCATVWPVLATPSKPVAGPGVNAAMLGQIVLKDGTRQVTYNGHPLYTYSGDSGPGQTDYVGANEFGGFWYAINASGAEVK